MVSGSGHDTSSIMRLPDDCLYLIFQHLKNGCDRESFGLTCRHWLHVQNSSRVSLQFQCSFSIVRNSSFSIVGNSSFSNTSTTITAFHLYRLLNRFRHLHSLSLSGCTELPDSGLTQLRHYGSKLHALHLDGCFAITDSGLSLVASGCPSLTLISLYRCNVTDVGLQLLAKSCSALKDVNLAYCSLISDNGVSALSQNCFQLRAVRISCCRSVSGVGFEGCCRAFAYLEAESCKLEPKGIMGIVSGGGLEYLNVSNLSWSIYGDGLAAIGCGLASRLKVLNFRLCRTIGNESVAAIARGCPLLEEWNLALCHEVKLLGWESIGSNCFNLKRLHVNRCRNICDQGLQALRDGCKQLSILYLNRCSHISSTAMELFKCLRHDVEIREEEVMCIAPKWAFQL